MSGPQGLKTSGETVAYGAATCGAPEEPDATPLLPRRSSQVVKPAQAGALTTPPPGSCRAASSARIASRALWSVVSLAESAAFVAYEASSAASALEAWSAEMPVSRLASCAATKAAQDTFPMLPFYSKVMAKTKRWHKKGPLASPFREVRLLGPSPMMSWGWVVQTEDGAIQHTRAAVLTDEEADHARDLEVGRVRYDLEMEEHPERPRTRLTGKQSLDPSPKLGVDGEEGHPAADGEGLAPALRELRTGGEYTLHQNRGVLKEAWRKRRTS